MPLVMSRRVVMKGVVTCGAVAVLPQSHLQAASAEDLPGLLRITGQVKWFDAAKGYGFIVPDGDLVRSDVLLHHVCLENSGFTEAPEGARVIAHAVRRPKGWQAFLILSLDVSTATPVSSRPCRLHQQLSDIEVAELQAFSKTRLSWNG
ncbi:cold shock domain-containing protein [Hyphomicrobium sp.]|uniref:cold shock domain-containing protein n=1 Tax=Hyphomicrobium sp. TaxID=82 RepID=UPI002E2F00B9|nr:cold shock domain-containing protein [Hyphomicrobium sp.]HEX2839922.1 cold shock domain-containing protein [Hyphomicrobium sp.]